MLFDFNHFAPCQNLLYKSSYAAQIDIFHYESSKELENLLSYKGAISNVIELTKKFSRASANFQVHYEGKKDTFIDSWVQICDRQQFPTLKCDSYICAHMAQSNSGIF